MTVDSLEAVRKQITVEVPQERAFDVFTTQMAAWWNPDHHIGANPYVELVIEPREGGGWYEVDADGTRCPWGTVLVWDPPARVVLNWQLNGQWAYDPEQLTELELRFTALSDSSTLVELEHRKLEGLGAGAAEARAQLDAESGWQGLLARLGAHLTR
jgi:uncharacterized protein YndB with AHSA1/START domain